MIDPANVPDVTSEEELARFVLYSRHIRSNNGTLKSDAFMPHPDGLDMSVTRHLLATEAEIWEVGETVAFARGVTLHGRGDFGAGVCEDQKLVVTADPIIGNPNHANITGWPTDKPQQKAIAQELAAAALFVARN